MAFIRLYLCQLPASITWTAFPGAGGLPGEWSEVVQVYEGSETMMGTLDLSPAHDPFRLVYGVRVSPMVLGGTAAVRGRRCTVVAPYAHTHTQAATGRRSLTPIPLGVNLPTPLLT